MSTKNSVVLNSFYSSTAQEAKKYSYGYINCVENIHDWEPYPKIAGRTWVCPMCGKIKQITDTGVVYLN